MSTSELVLLLQKAIREQGDQPILLPVHCEDCGGLHAASSAAVLLTDLGFQIIGFLGDEHSDSKSLH